MKKQKSEGSFKLKIELTLSNKKKEEHIFPGPKIIIGRGTDADLQIKEDSIGRKHLLIELVNKNKIMITDLGSVNGTYLGEDKIPPQTPTEFDTFFLPIFLGKKISIVLELIPDV